MFSIFKKKDVVGLSAEELKIKREKRARQIAVLNKYSICFHVLLACGVCFLIEWVSRHSFMEACYFVVDRNLVFLYNSLIVFASLTVVYLFRRRAVLRTIISVFWVFLGVINGCILAKRVSPFSFTDLKMVGDLFTMQSNYFTNTEAAVVIVLVALVLTLLVWFWFHGPKFAGHPHRIVSLAMVAGVMMMLPNVTNAAVSNHILTSYFENLAQGYKDYGFVYSFSASVLDRGMSVPEGYSEEAVGAVLQRMQTAAGVELNAQEIPVAGLEPNAEKVTAATLEPNAKELTAAALEEKTDEGVKPQYKNENQQEIPEETDAADELHPNIICVLLESFVDPGLIRFLQTDKDPIPNFHSLYENYTSGYLEVPVVGAGTANTEFEVLTGMGMQFFGLGEYPYKTILKKTNCESIASDLHTLGYGTHVVHNNGGNFYSRRNAFSMMGFDTFTSKELMDIQDYTPLGTWPTDDILIGEVEKSLDFTPNQRDFVYTITVEGHGDYPTEKILEEPEIIVTGASDEASANQWEYYVNQIHQVDDFIGDLIAMLDERDEPTFVVMFGDHLPTMGLSEEDMRTGSLFRTQYITWNNFGMEKQDADMTSYQLLADMTKSLGIQNGTMFTFHQNRNAYTEFEQYQSDMQMLQYDILYGDHYVYNGANPYPASNLLMGTQEVIVKDVIYTQNAFYIVGENFTKWSKVFVDDEKIGTSYVSSNMLRVKREKIEDGEHTIVVNQLGSSDTVFRSSNAFTHIF